MYKGSPQKAPSVSPQKVSILEQLEQYEKEVEEEKLREVGPGAPKHTREMRSPVVKAQSTVNGQLVRGGAQEQPQEGLPNQEPIKPGQGSKRRHWLRP